MLSYQIKKAHQKSKAYKAAQKASQQNNDPKTRYVSIVVNDKIELVVGLFGMDGYVQIILATVDETELSEDDVNGISKAFAEKYLA